MAGRRHLFHHTMSNTAFRLGWCISCLLFTQETLFGERGHIEKNNDVVDWYDRFYGKPTGLVSEKRES